MMKYNLYKIYSTTKCFNFKKYLTKSLQQWAFRFYYLKDNFLYLKKKFSVFLIYKNKVILTVINLTVINM